MLWWKSPPQRRSISGRSSFCRVFYITMPISHISSCLSLCARIVYESPSPLRGTAWIYEEEEEEEFITSDSWRGRHNSLPRGAGADQP